MSRRVRLAPEARRDIAGIARESMQDFGGTIWSACRARLEQALSDLGEDAERLGSRDISDIRPGTGFIICATAGGGSWEGGSGGRAMSSSIA